MRNRAALLPLVLAGCMVGPDYHRPAAPAPAAFKELAGWQPAAPADADAKGPWWAVFHDPLLDRLERQVVITNQTVKEAEASYRQALALVAEAQAGLFPTLGVSPTISRSSLNSSFQSLGGGGRQGDHAIQHRGQRRLGPRCLGPHPPPGGEPAGLRRSERRRPRQRAAVGAGGAGRRLFRPARRGFARAVAARHRGRLPARAADHDTTNTTPAPPRAATSSPPTRSSSRRRHSWSASACSARFSSTRSRC